MLDDLYQYCSPNNDYIIFVDDANRIDSFQQILGFYNKERTGTLKIIITVRDYVRTDIERLCLGYTPKFIPIEKLPGDKIKSIIEQKPYKILNSDYQEKIINIADGNPRFAIMAALLAKKEETLLVFNDISELFDTYFSTFIKDNEEFDKFINIQALGLIAFFNNFPFIDKEVSTKILKIFNIEYNSFYDSVHKLDSLELVSIHYENVKIPEQNLASYFFYKAFISKPVLSFGALFNSSYPKYKARFLDCIIPVNNNFGRDKVMKAIKPTLSIYFKSIEGNIELKNDFLLDFWFYFIEDSFAFIYDFIESISKNNNDKKMLRQQQYQYNQNIVLKLLTNLFSAPPCEDLKNAINLALEYAKVAPENLDAIIVSIQSKFIFKHDDEKINFERQSILLDLLSRTTFNKAPHNSVIFYDICPLFLQADSFYHNSSRGLTITTNHYIIPYSESLLDLREKIWQALLDNYIDFPEKSFGVLESYLEKSRALDAKILEFDRTYVYTIITQHLSNSNFKHCKFVNSQFKIWQNNSTNLSEISKLPNTFSNSIYKLFTIMNPDFFYDKQTNIDLNYMNFIKNKESKIKSEYNFNNNNECDNFIKDFYYLTNIYNDNVSNYNDSLELIINENLQKKEKIGLYLLSAIIKNNNPTNYIPDLSLRNCLDNTITQNNIIQLLESTKFNLQAEWKMSYYYNLPDDFIDESHICDIINTINNVHDTSLIALIGLEKYLQFEPNLFYKIFSTVRDMNNKKKNIRINHDVFTKYFDKFSNDSELIITTYIQQREKIENYDIDKKELISILKVYPNTLINLVESMDWGENIISPNHNYRLGCIWQVTNIEEILIRVFDRIIGKQPFYFSQHFCNIFFWEIPNDCSERAECFLHNYVEKNFDDYQKMNIILNITHNTMQRYYEDIILQYLSKDFTIEMFKNISWIDKNAHIQGEQLFGDIRLSRLKQLLSIIQRSTLGIKMIPYKSYIQSKIEKAEELLESEKRRRYLEK